MISKFIYCFSMTVTKQCVSPHSRTHRLSGVFRLMDSWLFSCSCFLWLLDSYVLSPYPWATRYDLDQKKRGGREGGRRKALLLKNQTLFQQSMIFIKPKYEEKTRSVAVLPYKQLNDNPFDLLIIKEISVSILLRYYV